MTGDCTCVQLVTVQWGDTPKVHGSDPYCCEHGWLIRCTCTQTMGTYVDPYTRIDPACPEHGTARHDGDNL